MAQKKDHLGVYDDNTQPMVASNFGIFGD